MIDFGRCGCEAVEVVDEREFYGFESECAYLEERVFAFAYVTDGFAVAPFHFRRIPIPQPVLHLHSLVVRGHLLEAQAARREEIRFAQFANTADEQGAPSAVR